MAALPQPVAVGVIGCGTISDIYFSQMAKFPNLRLVACADIVAERAAAKAAAYGIRALTVDALLAEPEIELVVNLTIPSQHAAVNLAALTAGKSIYCEKPLALSSAECQQILDLAKQSNLLVGNAPDTFLGGGLQTGRQYLDAGAVGQPIQAVASFQSSGPEGWHPQPDFYFAPGGGPMFDMGPYYLSALVMLLGPVRRVAGLTKITHAERTIGTGPRKGERIPVTTPTHIAGVLEFDSGAMGTIVTSFDTHARYRPTLEITGTAGTLRLPDPNTFGGPLYRDQPGENDWQAIAIPFGYTTNSRGLGVADLASALRKGRPPRASGALGAHVVEIMEAFGASASTDRLITLTTTCERPAPMVADAEPYHIAD